MKLSEMNVQVLRDLGDKDILIIQHNGKFGKLQKGMLGQFAGYLRKNFDWHGLIIELSEDQKLTKLNDHAALSLYNMLRERFEDE